MSAKRLVCVQNTTREQELGDAIEMAETSRDRRRGLLKLSGLEEGAGLWIIPCEAIHTFGMRFPIDVVFLSKRRRVLKIRKRMPRRRIAVCLRAHSTLELPSGTLDRTGTEPGDQLQFKLQ